MLPPPVESREKEWVAYNPQTMTYDTRDGTKIAAELVENVQCLADVLYISILRERQREAMRKRRNECQQ